MFKVHSVEWNYLLVIVSCLAIAALLADNISTAFCLTFADHALEETNPLSRHFLDGFGVAAVMAVNAIAGILFIIGLSLYTVLEEPEEHWARAIMTGLVIITISRAVGAINNCYIIHGILKL